LARKNRKITNLTAEYCGKVRVLQNPRTYLNKKQPKEKEMNKADIYIYKVKYDEDGNAISQVKIAFTTDLSQKFNVPRKMIVALLKTEKLSIKTCIQKNDKWVTGDDVVLYDDEFITTAGNGRRSDNLENLPEF
jgi:hypothetical protein